MRRPLAGALLVLLLGWSVAACGGGGADDSDDATDATADDGASAASEAEQDDDDAETASSASGGAYPSCPLTPETLAPITGEPMEQDGGICQFHPASGKLNPNILFVKQSPVLDDEEVREETGLVTAIDGIGDEAYAAAEEVTGTRVAVRDGRQWFEVTVDILSDPAKELDWAKQIAKLIADAN